MAEGLSSSVMLVFILFTYLAINAAASLPLQQTLDKIDQLPGQPSVTFDQYSGYVTVDKTAGRAFFYWLVEAPQAAQPAPLLLWLNGGPGCSSIAFGMFEKLAPFDIHPDGRTLYLNTYAWNNEANMLFLDSPAGVGFSYSNTSSDLYTPGDKRTALDNYNFLINWIERFPQYKHRDFYIAGQSYAGNFVPSLSQIIYRKNKGIQNPSINLKGFMVGNPVIDSHNDFVGFIQYLWVNGLISDHIYRNSEFFCKIESPLEASENCLKYLLDVYNEMGYINYFNIFTPICKALDSSSTHRRSKRSTFRQLSRTQVSAEVDFEITYKEVDICLYKHFVAYYNLPEVQKALHANTTGINYEWQTCNGVVLDNWTDSAGSMLPIYKELISGGLKIWIFSGNTDSVVPVASTRYSLNALNLTTLVKWYPWYDQGMLSGWSEVYNGLTFVIVHGAGHTVPLDKPPQALILLKHFLKNKLMPSEK